MPKISVQVIVKWFPEKHFEDLIECEFSIKFKLNVLHDGINVIIT